MKYSIITICRNNLAGLIKTYESVRIQTSKDFEWIVIDGNSNDGTKEWLNNLPKDGIAWVSEPDSGLYNAMNKGLKLAGGEYLIFMNSSDQFASADILKQTTQCIDASAHKPLFIYGDSIDINSKGDRLYYKAKGHQNIWKCMFTHHQAMFFERDFLSNIKYDENFKICSDYKFICEYFIKIRKMNINGAFLKVESPICIFLLGGLNETQRRQSLFEDYAIRKEVLKLNFFTCASLFVMHYCHYLLKRIMPDAMRMIRYKKED